MSNATFDPGTAELTAQETQQILEHFRTRIAEKLGVTLATDYNGASGEAGATYLTVRGYLANKPLDLVQATFKLMTVSSSEADEEKYRLYNENK